MKSITRRICVLLTLVILVPALACSNAGTEDTGSKEPGVMTAAVTESPKITSMTPQESASSHGGTLTVYPTPKRRNPAESAVVYTPELLAKTFNILFEDSGVRERLAGKAYGKDYIISEVLPVMEALDRIPLSEDEFPYPFAAVVVVTLGKLENPGANLLAVIDMQDGIVTAIFTEER